MVAYLGLIERQQIVAAGECERPAAIGPLGGPRDDMVCGRLLEDRLVVSGLNMDLRGKYRRDFVGRGEGQGRVELVQKLKGFSPLAMGFLPAPEIRICAISVVRSAVPKRTPPSQSAIGMTLAWLGTVDAWCRAMSPAPLAINCSMAARRGSLSKTSLIVPIVHPEIQEDDIGVGDLGKVGRKTRRKRLDDRMDGLELG